MLSPVPIPTDYNVSPVTGFLPESPPLQQLPDPYYNRWEAIMANMQPLILTKRFREMIHRLPILDASRLQTENEFRRAYVMLTFMAHAYIWSGISPADRLPPSICVPLLAVSSHLEVPPVASYASTCLWNHRFVFEDDDSHEIDNLATLFTFTGSLDESWFYLISAAIEAKAGPAIPLGLGAIQAVRDDDVETVIMCLKGLASTIEQVGALLMRTYENCDPHVFYHQIRPYLAGSKNMADAGLPYGIIYDDYSGQESYRQYSGASAAESSSIQYLDVILGVEHFPTGQKVDHDKQNKRQHFLVEMRGYMPQSHRRFLEDVERIANIREYAQGPRRSSHRLEAAYDKAVESLKEFRNKHIQIVTRYIILKSREATKERNAATVLQGRSYLNLATSATKASVSNPSQVIPSTVDPSKLQKKEQTGTGGTALMPFLKQSRDETAEMTIGRESATVKDTLSPLKPINSGMQDSDRTLSAARRLSSSQAEHGLMPGLSAGAWQTEGVEGGICFG